MGTTLWPAHDFLHFFMACSTNITLSGYSLQLLSCDFSIPVSQLNRFYVPPKCLELTPFSQKLIFLLGTKREWNECQNHIKINKNQQIGLNLA